jgi:DNA primase
MIKILILSLIFFTACSFKTPQNEWQYKSANAFNSYTKNFLGSNDILAKSDLDRAIKHAKKSADLTELAKIYLGECALNISVGKSSTCREYQNISELVQNRELQAYYALISLHVKKQQIEFLPQVYREFALHVEREEYKKAELTLLHVEKPISTLLCASLIKERVSNETKENMIKLASFNGYKKVVLFWLDELLKTTFNKKKKENIKKKISILIT